MFVISLLCIFGGFGVYFFPEYYLSELALSFLPYGIVLFLIGSIISFVALRKKLKKKKPSSTLFQKYSWICFLGFVSLFLLYSYSFNQFYNQHFIKEDQGDGLHVLFANILKSNYDFEGLENLILEHDPDVVMLVEFSEEHSEAMKDFFQERYPYVNRNSWSKTLAGDVVFSKYPLTNLVDQTTQGAWRYGYFSISYEGKDYFFYEIHTSSPASYSDFKARNIQLKKISLGFQEQKGDREIDSPVIMIGDFNVSPWSIYYQEFVSAFSSSEMVNVGRSFPIFFTWNMFYVLWSHIDHLFVTPNVAIWNVENIYVPGSDHRGYVFTLKA